MTISVRNDQFQYLYLYYVLSTKNIPWAIQKIVYRLSVSCAEMMRNVCVHEIIAGPFSETPRTNKLFYGY